jgi:hypothetical protein
MILDLISDLEISDRDFGSPEGLDELVCERSPLRQHLALAVALEASGAMHGAVRVLTGSATAGASDELEFVDDEGFVIHGRVLIGYSIILGDPRLGCTT